MKSHNSCVLLILAICIGLSSQTQAVVPPPDGGYAGGNTAEGQAALLSLTTGGFNTAVGFLSLRSNTTGQLNTAIGAGTLVANTADENTATGAGALLSNTTGSSNTANGAFALFSNTTGTSNTATGFGALFNNTTGEENTAFGTSALFNNTTGGVNTAIGFTALETNTTGYDNTAIGPSALVSNTEGYSNTATGFEALFSNTLGDHNTAVGSEALAHNNIGFDNTAVGINALFVWTGAGLGGFNTAIGANALANSTIGTGNVALGSGAGNNVTTASNVIAIGTSGNNVSNSCYIGNIFNATSSGGIAVFINSNGRLGTATSSRRFKEDIKPMERASEALFAFKPVTFHYKKEIDSVGTSQFGLVAEEVEKVNPDLVVYDKEGKPHSVRYDQVNAMLLNEFLKEHKIVQELQATVQKQEAIIAQQQKSFQSKLAKEEKRINALTSGLEKVSAQLELSKSRPQTVLNNP
jgi:hypothetical protein